MIKSVCVVLIVSLMVASPAFAQDVSRTQIQKLTKIEPAVRPSYLLPPQGQTDTGTAKPASGPSHKKRNIIIAVVVAAAVGGVIVAAHNGAYGSSGSGY